MTIDLLLIGKLYVKYNLSALKYSSAYSCHDSIGTGTIKNSLFSPNFCSVQPKSSELRRMVQKLEMNLNEKKRLLHKFLDLNEGIEAAKKWSNSALEHLQRQDNPRTSLSDEDVFSQIRQIDYLLSKSRELKLRNRRDFEDTFEELKDMLTAQTIFAVDDALDQLEDVTVQVMQRRDELRARATR